MMFVMMPPISKKPNADLFKKAIFWPVHLPVISLDAESSLPMSESVLQRHLPHLPL
ncbi:hypothetical protein Hdeb2414_s0021g00574331 [Helianthus debilis subsp. tardiflorus]